MSGSPLILLYLFTLAVFLGLDLIRKVPPTLHGALAAGMGASAAVLVVAALLAAGRSSRGALGALTTVAVMVTAAGAVAGLIRLGRLSRPPHKTGGRS
ncbi:MAG: proton-translocating transhydrogenase family protein [Polyangia bacterium]|jgi:NAD(P) transhydrogenase subunit alpha